uniref:FAS1 domain-containing protein n=1 Tax=Panagrellus redivivus TaxID=6233 RepID=A0A7E5A1P1_PANRE
MMMEKTSIRASNCGTAITLPLRRNLQYLNTDKTLTTAVIVPFTMYTTEVMYKALSSMAAEAYEAATPLLETITLPPSGMRVGMTNKGRPIRMIMYHLRFQILNSKLGRTCDFIEYLTFLCFVGNQNTVNRLIEINVCPTNCPYANTLDNVNNAEAIHVLSK